MSAEFEVVLQGGLDAPELARHGIAANEPAPPRSLRDDLSALVSELVINAVRHGIAASNRPLQERWCVRPARAGSCVRFELPAGLTA